MNTPNERTSDKQDDSPTTSLENKHSADAEETQPDETVEIELSPDQLPHTVGAKIAGYEIVKQIGSGAMGLVYQARQVSLDRLVAIKTIQPCMGADSKALDRFEKEALAIAKLTHPNIVSAYDFGRDRDQLFLAMELIDGEELARWIESNAPLSEKQAWSIARQLAAGLSHADRHGVTHRDVKPANVIVLDAPEGFELPDGVPMAKLTDFGLALLADANEIEKSTSAFGSPAYMAPELFSGEDSNQSTDIFALGMTVYHMLVGSPPHLGQTLSLTIRAKLAGERPRLQDYRGDLSDKTIELFDRMTAPERAKRISDYSSLIESIRVLSGHEFDKMAVSSSNQPGARTKKPRFTRTLLVPTILALILFSSMLLILVYDRGPAERTLQANGPSVLLFDGQSLDFEHWNLGESSGGWSVKQGELVHGQESQQPYLVGRHPGWSHYVLSLNVRLEPDSVARLHFQIEGDHRDSPRVALDLSNGSAKLGKTLKPATEFVSSLGNTTLSPDRETHFVKLEKERDHWWVSVNGNLVGTVRSTGQFSNSEMALSAVSGTVAFSEINARELTEPQ